MSKEITAPATEKLPYINEQGDLIIPIDAPERYHYLKDGALSIAKILAELHVPPEMVNRYTKSFV